MADIGDTGAGNLGYAGPSADMPGYAGPAPGFNPGPVTDLGNNLGNGFAGIPGTTLPAPVLGGDFGIPADAGGGGLVGGPQFEIPGYGGSVPTFTPGTSVETTPYGKPISSVYDFHVLPAPDYQFDKNDVFVNRIKAHPSVNIFLYNGQMYYQKTNQLRENPDLLYNDTATSIGYVNLFEMNIDRGSHYTNLSTNPHTKLITPFVIKNGTSISFKTTTDEDFNTQYDYGDKIYGSYPMTASFRREYFAEITAAKTTSGNDCASPLPANAADLSDSCYIPEPFAVYQNADGIVINVNTADVVPPGAVYSSLGTYPGTAGGSGPYDRGGNYNKTSRFNITALKNTLNYHTRLSPHYAFSASVPGSGIERNFAKCEMNLISIPSIYYGSKIKPGTVDLKFFLSGSVAGRLQDITQRGELIQTGPENGTGSPDGSGQGRVAGVVLYEEGFIILTGSWGLIAGSNQPSVHKENYESNSAKVNPSWVHFGARMPGDGTPTVPSSNHVSSSAFEIAFSGTTYIPTLTMLAHAPLGRLNHSNNPTYPSYGQSTVVVPKTSQRLYRENESRTIKNTISSSFKNATASYEHQTFISKVGIYDNNRNLIAITKMATPVKKTQEAEYTFKMKLDL
tara:strand:+ start:4624 stop:6492 length:1869 start_codon:yes stop_codon:yes gene_type:complete